MGLFLPGSFGAGVSSEQAGAARINQSGFYTQREGCAAVAMRSRPLSFNSSGYGQAGGAVINQLFCHHLYPEHTGEDICIMLIYA